jgi:hypothetical protein
MDRKRIFKLLAMGRISAAEAERLIAAWQVSRENSLIVIGCIGVALLAVLNLSALPVVREMIHTLRVTK